MKKLELLVEGDKIKITKLSNHGYKVGDIITIKELFEDHLEGLELGRLNESWFLGFDEIESATK